MNRLRDTIEQLSRCKFDYETPEIILSVDHIEINLEEGKESSGSFIITNSNHSAIKGIVYSSKKIITFTDNQFSDVENEIQFKIDGQELVSGESYHVEISIISNCKEVVLPVSIQVIAPFYVTSFGKMKDLFQFADLAKENWTGALELFRSTEFERVFLHNDHKNKMIYDNLMKSTNLNTALEEFLIAVHKKIPINLQIDKQNLEYKIDSVESFMDRITLTKDQWGYLEVDISTDTSFISLEHTTVRPENFIGNSYGLEFIINPSYLRDGRNFGRIFITTYNQVFVVNIICHYIKETRIREEHNRLNKRCQLELTKSYLKFRLGTIKLNEYIQEAEGILHKISGSPNQILYTMLTAHLYIITEQEEKAGQLLDTLNDYENEFKQSAGLKYCAYLYLKALYHKEQNIIDHAVREIRYIYENGHKDHRILWFLLYLDKNYEENIMYKLAQIKEQVLSGTHSPILYFEALNILNKEPSLLHEIGIFEFHIINFGIKYEAIGKDMAAQFTYLAGREKTYRYNIFKNLVILYDKYYSEEILTGICSLLIKGQKTDKKYFQWYRLGVEAQLKITGLHESYMYSIDEESNIILSSPILLYFIYNSNLSDNKKAYLYAYIIRNKAQNASIYRTYLKQMENFCMKQIGSHNINRNLSIIYEDLLTKDMITESVAYDLPYIMFRHVIKCDNHKIKGVVVVHKELKTESYVPLVEGEAQINIFTENAEVFFVDHNENRHLSAIDYKITKLMNSDRFIDVCYNYQIDNYMLLLSLAEKINKYQKFDDNAVLVREKVIHLSDLREEYFKMYFWDLIQYHHDSLDGNYLFNHLLHLNIKCLNKFERAQVLEYAIVAGMYMEVFSFIIEYGFEQISVKRLLKLCRELIARYDKEVNEEFKEEFITICFYVFHSGKYDDTILQFLVKYYNGTTKDMYELWKISKEFNLTTTELEERLLGQMLFAKSYVGNPLEIFASYYGLGHNSKLIKGFLSFYAYRYLVHDRVVDEELFSIIQKELVIAENDVCMLAVLKYFSIKNELSEEEIKFAKFHVFEYIKKGFSLPFFQKFQKSFQLPSYISDKYYVEYIADPKKKVVIHYRINKDSNEEFISQTMNNVYLGIHVKEFIIFYDEELQYYITEKDENGESITESISVKIDKTMDEEDNSKYNLINLMLMAKELKDDKTLVQLMENYMRSEFIKNGLIKMK